MGKKPNTRLEITNVRLYGKEPAVTIGVDGGIITHISRQPQGWPRIVDGCDYIAIPGAIDGHVHSRFPAEEHKEEWSCLEQAAAVGGLTTICDMPNNCGPHAVVSADILQHKDELIRRRKRPRLSYKLFFGATASNLAELPKIKDLPYLAGIKIYMEQTTGNILLADLEAQRAWCAAAAEAGVLVVVHVGNQAMIDKNRSRIPQPTVQDHCVIRDTDVELSGGQQAIAIARQTGCRLHIAHTSTPELAEAVQQAQQGGRQVTCEVCPHHLCFDEGALAREDGAFFKMNPPLRTPAQVTRLTQHLCDGIITTIATDHAPHTVGEKRVRDYDAIPSGVPGVQEMLLMLYQQVVAGRITLHRLIDLTARNPARLFGFANKGELKVGFDADIVLLDPKARTIFAHDKMHSRCGWTAYNGMEVVGSVVFVMAGGNVMINNLPPKRA